MAIGIAFAIVGATIYAFKESLKAFLTLYMGRCFTTPVGVVTFMFANGRGKVVSRRVGGFGVNGKSDLGEKVGGEMVLSIK